MALPGLQPEEGRPMKTYATEAELCADFIKYNEVEWTAYPETCGWDILMVRKADGFQIGIQAKLLLNAKVVCQAAEELHHWFASQDGPDCRAVLVPNYAKKSLGPLLQFLHLTGIYFGEEEDYSGNPFLKQHPEMPKADAFWEGYDWKELAPDSRHELPKYMPDVKAGVPAPRQLTPWKVKAIKLAVMLEKEGSVTRHDFRRMEVSMTLWTQKNWIVMNPAVKGTWVKTERFPDFRKQHPTNYAEIENDYANWKKEN